TNRHVVSVRSPQHVDFIVLVDAHVEDALLRDEAHPCIVSYALAVEVGVRVDEDSRAELLVIRVVRHSPCLRRCEGTTRLVTLANDHLDVLLNVLRLLNEVLRCPPMVFHVTSQGYARWLRRSSRAVR